MRGHEATELWGWGELEDRREEEWQPGGALREALGGMPLWPQTGRVDDPARVLAELSAGLRPHVEEALGELGALERRRGLSELERLRAEALGMLLASIRQT